MLGKKYKQPLEIKHKEFYGWSGQQMEKLCVFGFFQTFWILLTFPSVDANETISNILQSFHHCVYRFYFQGFSYWGVRGRGVVPTINLTKNLPISPPYIQSLFQVFCMKTKLCKIFTKVGSIWLLERQTKLPHKISVWFAVQKRCKT